MEDFTKDMLLLAGRRDKLGKMMNEFKLTCDSCGSRQIQLVAYIDVCPAKWKCRKCKNVFQWGG